MTTTTIERRAAQPDLPPLTATDRVALSIGTHLILRAEQHRVLRAERAARAEQARITRSTARAARATASTFEHRAYAGPTW